MTQNTSPICYEICANSDRTEGRGPDFGTGVAFKHNADGQAFVVSQYYRHHWGIMGASGGPWDVKARKEWKGKVYASLQEFEALHPSSEVLQEIKEKALLKLTEIERIALGIQP